MRPRALLAASLALLAGCNALLGIDDPHHSTCGDGVTSEGEECDDGNEAPGDGCDAACRIEPGFSCEGQGEGSCQPVCGDGVVVAGEGCDDGGRRAGDGCSAACQVEPGYSCSGAPSACAKTCGNGVVEPLEACDDGNDHGGDGCSATCTIEPGYSCSGAPSACSPRCGDGLVRGDEECDDGNQQPGDGCSASCVVEHGYACAGAPSACASTCGDGLVASDEQCDDENDSSADGCVACHIVTGYTCAGEPSVCLTTCGDGVLALGEQCDDGNTQSGDGCSAACQLEPGFTCGGQDPTQCAPICGDGKVVYGEGCDDGGVTPGDGCSATCQVEPGYSCAGQPSACAPICGDGVLAGGEECDDGNTTPGDCCSATCQIEPGCQLEVEPDDSVSLADGSSVKIEGTTRIRGAVEPAGDADYFAVSLGNFSSVVRIETFDGSGKDCLGATNTRLSLLSSSGIPMYTDDDDGIGACSALAVVLPGGGYYLRVTEASGGLVPAYLLDFHLEVQLAAESEPNDTMAAATPFFGTEGFLAGSHTVATDVDWFTFNIPTGVPKSMRAELIEGSTAESCESSGIASRLSLFSSTGVMLADDNLGGGRGLCSLLDGTGSSPLTAGASDLAPGTYYLRVMAASSATGTAAQFAYRVSFVLR